MFSFPENDSVLNDIVTVATFVNYVHESVVRIQYKSNLSIAIKTISVTYRQI